MENKEYYKYINSRKKRIKKFRKVAKKYYNNHEEYSYDADEINLPSFIGCAFAIVLFVIICSILKLPVRLTTYALISSLFLSLLYMDPKKRHKLFDKLMSPNNREFFRIICNIISGNTPQQNTRTNPSNRYYNQEEQSNSVYDEIEAPLLNI